MRRTALEIDPKQRRSDVDKLGTQFLALGESPSTPADPQSAANVRAARAPDHRDIMFKWRLLVEDGRKVGNTLGVAIPLCVQ
jgi:hypothetical protein